MSDLGTDTGDRSVPLTTDMGDRSVPPTAREGDTLVPFTRAPARSIPPGSVPFRPFDPFAPVDIHAGNLPHWQQPGACYFITFRLSDSLPASLLGQWREERAIWLRLNPVPWTAKQHAEYEKRFTQQQEDWLDAGHGACHLRRSDLRALIRTSIGKSDGIRYDVDALVIMPNHVHLLWQLRNEARLPKELKGLKGATARACNLDLGQAGPFWMDESYDRIVRNAEELAAFRKYIKENPAKAKLNEGEFTLETRSKLYVREYEEQ